MPTPSPIMAIISGAKVGVVMTWESRSSTAKADGDAEQGGDDGEAHGHHGTERQQHDDDGGQDADALGRAGSRGGHQADGLAPQGHVVPRGGERLGRGDHLLDGGRGQVAGLLVEDHLHVGDTAVRGDLMRAGRRERADHLRHVGQRPEGRDEPGGAGLHRGTGDRSGEW
jgi:hypothetical protein